MTDVRRDHETTMTCIRLAPASRLLETASEGSLAALKNSSGLVEAPRSVSDPSPAPIVTLSQSFDT
jgi:hypothetical protein